MNQQSIKESVGMFASRDRAEAASRSLAEAGFAANQIGIDTQVLDPNPRIRDTKAAKSAGGGAIAGSLFGALVGLLLVIISLNPLTSIANPAVTQPWLTVVGVTLAAAGVGAAGGALMAALSGLNVPKDEMGVDRDRLSHNYLVTLEGAEADLQWAKEFLRSQGSQL
jgi:uncharacterized membrane protein